MRHLSHLIVAIVICSPPALAQMSEEFVTWPSGPVGVLLTDQERQQYASLGSDREAQRFIELFWARRDPDLSTRENEFREDFEARVRAADAQFATDDVEGWATDRGRTLILLGLPNERKTGRIVDYFDARYGDSRRGDGNLRNQKIGEITDLSDYLKHETGGRSRRGDFDDVASDASFRESESTSGTTTRHGVEFNLASGAVDVWAYGQSQLPAPLRDEMKGVEVPFFDPAGSGEFHLEQGVVNAEEWQRVLSSAPSTFIAHPDLDQPPVYPLLPGRPAASDAQLAMLGDPAARWPEGAQAVAVRGLASASQAPVWVFLQLPPDVPDVDRAIGRLTSPEGWVEGTFAVPLTGEDADLGRFYELRVPEWRVGDTLEIALVTGDSVIGRCALEVDLGGIDPAAPFFTAFHAGAEVQERPSFALGDPFTYGGYHLVVRPAGFYASDEQLSYLMLAALPEAPSGQPVTLTLSSRVTQGPDTLFSTPRQAVELSPVAPGVYMYGSQLPISALPGPGEYRLRLTVSDETSGVSRSTNIRFTVVGSLDESPALSRPGYRHARGVSDPGRVVARASTR